MFKHKVACYFHAKQEPLHGRIGLRQFESAVLFLGSLFFQVYYFLFRLKETLVSSLEVQRN